MRHAKPVIISTLGMAAAIGLVFGVLFPPVSEPRVQAAELVKSLNRQIAEQPLVEVSVENVVMDEVSLNGHFQVGRSGVAGDMAVIVDESDGRVEVDASLGLRHDGGWILLRKLTIPDAEAQVFVNMFLGGADGTLIHLPAGEGNEAGAITGAAAEVAAHVTEAAEHLGSDELILVFKELIASHADYGVTVTNQRDGTVLLTLPIESEQALEALGSLFERIESLDHDAPAAVHGKPDAKKKGPPNRPHHGAGFHQGHHDAEGLIGATLSAVYDPATESVRMLQIANLGAAKGRVTVGLYEGDLDPALLDAARVTKPGTRVLDLSAMQSVISGFMKESGRE